MGIRITKIFEEYTDKLFEIQTEETNILIDLGFDMCKISEEDKKNIILELDNSKVYDAVFFGYNIKEECNLLKLMKQHTSKYIEKIDKDSILSIDEFNKVVTGSRYFFSDNDHIFINDILVIPRVYNTEREISCFFDIKFNKGIWTIPEMVSNFDDDFNVSYFEDIFNHRIACIK